MTPEERAEKARQELDGGPNLRIIPGHKSGNGAAGHVNSYDQTKGAGEDTAEPFDAWRISDMRKLKPPEYVIQGVLPARAQSTIFAPSGHYKTMTALDMVVAIAFGREFHGFAVKPCPIIYVAREDAYNLARQRLLGLLDYYRLTDERIIVVPGDVSLTDPAVVERLLATKRVYFPGEEPAYNFDTWDRCIGADPDKTAEVVPAVERVDDLIKAGAPFALTLSHSPWSSPERTKGAVPYWASQAARWKAERDEVTGHGKLDLVHMKNGPSGLHLEFEYLQHAFTVDGETSTCLVPQRIYGAPERTPPKTPARPPHGAVQKILLAELGKLARRHPDGVDETELKSAFVLQLDVHRRTSGEPSLQPKHATDKFNKTLARLVEAGDVDRLVGGQLLPGIGS